MNPFWPLVLVSPSNYTLLTLRRRTVGNVSIIRAHLSGWRAASSDSSVKIDTPRDTQEQLRDHSVGSYPQSGHPTARFDWHARKDGRHEFETATRVRRPFLSQRYLPSVRELLKGFWSLDQNPLWLLVDQLVTVGKPHHAPDTCPEFPQWRHIIEAPTMAAVISTLVAQGSLLEPQFEEDADEEFVDSTGVHPAPTWLVLYILVAKVDSRVAAHQGLAFGLSQLDNTPIHLRVPLLLLSMCSLSAHGLAPQALVVMESFHDVFVRKESSWGEAQRKPDPHQEDEYTQSLGSQESIIYQHNVLLTLLSRFTYVPGLPMRVGRLLRHMETRRIPIETAAAKQLLASRLASRNIVRIVRAILDKQEAAQSISEQSDTLAISLTRFFSKRGDHKEARKYLNTARRTNPLQHAKTYILSFRDVSASLSYIGTIEQEREHEDDIQKNDGLASMEDQYATGPSEKGLASTLMSRRNRGVTYSSKPTSTTPPMRHIYTSMLFTAALNTTISVSTFHSLYTSIRDVHGADKVLETVALTGLLRRNAWNEAKSLWTQWQTERRSLRVKHLEAQEYFQRRDRLFGDAEDVRKAIDWTKFKEYLLQRSIYMMELDATALAISVRVLGGPGTTDLLEAFEVMDGHAIKVGVVGPSPSDGANLRPPQPPLQGAIYPPRRNRPENVRLTSRVVNTFMARAFHLRRLDVVFQMWSGMTSYYGVDTSLTSLDILFRSARVAMAMENSLSQFIPRWLQKGTSWDHIREKVIFPDLGEEIRWMLSPDCKPGLRWNGAPPWRVVRRIFREEILFANWPWLRDVEVPAHPVRGDAATSRIDALKELAMGGAPTMGAELGQMGKYPHLVPSMRSFREYVLLLSRAHRSSEIPEMLAWMKALGVQPSRRMLSMCLALWAEVGLGSPADDVWVESGHRSNGQNGHAIGVLKLGGEYGKLITWLEEWLGKGEVPSDAEALDSLRYVRELEEAEAIHN